MALFYDSQMKFDRHKIVSLCANHLINSLLLIHITASIILFPIQSYDTFYNMALDYNSSYNSERSEPSVARFLHSKNDK
jgi:hypothetical protein